MAGDKKALLVIDIQNDYFWEKRKKIFTYDTDKLVGNINRAIASYNETGYDIPPMTPFVGANFNLTRAGIHADGMMKNPEIYNIFDTESILNRPPKVSVNNTSGIAGVAYWINNKRKSEGLGELTKDDPLVKAMGKWVMDQYDEGRITVISDAELEEKYAEFKEA